MMRTGWNLLGLAALALSPMPGLAAPPDDASPGIIVEQNLFHPSRSVPLPPPPLVVATPKPAPPPPPPKFELSGVVTIDGEPSMALVQEPQLTQGKSTTIKLGDALGAYKLVAVEADRVRFEGAAGTVTVLLHDPTKASKAVTAVASASQAGAPRAVGPPAVPVQRRGSAPGQVAAPSAEPRAASEGAPEADPDAKAKETLGMFQRVMGGLGPRGPKFITGEDSQNTP